MYYLKPSGSLPGALCIQKMIAGYGRSLVFTVTKLTTLLLEGVFMFAYIWPIALVVVSSTLYQVCAKSIPTDIDPFASLTITYLVGAMASFILYFLINCSGNLVQEYRHANWAPVVLGLVVVSLELGMIFAYKAGWPVSLAHTVPGPFVAIALVAVGALFYHETITVHKLLGIAICLCGLAVMNR